MNGFQTNTTALAPTPLDPFKRVKYNLGMVLGVDDFDQEFAYLAGQDEWRTRDLIGYGTVCGLQVTTEVDARGPRVVVSPGVAVNPRGQMIRVTPAQCAYLNDWLDANREEVLRHTTSPVADAATLFVVLCYRDCPTDDVPIPGEPCRTEGEATIASRLQDDFKLELRFEPPDQAEEDALREFAGWLRQVEIGDVPTSLSLADFALAVRSGETGSPLAATQINTADACDYLRAAFRIWVTELRALARGAACDGTAPGEDCVLLAQLTIPLTDQLQVADPDAMEVEEERRPFVVHLRLLQEWLLCGAQALGAGGSGETLALSDTVRFENAFGLGADAGSASSASRGDHTHGTPPAPVGDGGTPSSTVITENAFGMAANPGAATTFSRGDHTHGTPGLPAIPQPGDIVTPETAFGLSANAGASPLYSRADHTHGSPTGGTVSGDFVEHPPGLPVYQIVAAGMLSARNPIAPLYNNLSIVAIPNDGEVVFSFDGYDGWFNQEREPGIAQLIVKALPVFAPQVELPLLVNFLNFGKDGFHLRVCNIRGVLLKRDDLATVEFMIEVSKYFGKSIGIAPARARVNLNTATVEEIRGLPRIGPELAKRIVALRRRTRGGFKTLDDLSQVEGIGEDILRVLEPFVTLVPPR